LFTRVFYVRASGVRPCKFTHCFIFNFLLQEAWVWCGLWCGCVWCVKRRTNAHTCRRKSVPCFGTTDPKFHAGVMMWCVLLDFFVCMKLKTVHKIALLMPDGRIVVQVNILY
jgi:hypothetical protein